MMGTSLYAHSEKRISPHTTIRVMDGGPARTCIVSEEGDSLSQRRSRLLN